MKNCNIYVVKRLYGILFERFFSIRVIPLIRSKLGKESYKIHREMLSKHLLLSVSIFCLSVRRCAFLELQSLFICLFEHCTRTFSFPVNQFSTEKTANFSPNFFINKNVLKQFLSRFHFILVLFLTKTACKYSLKST